MNTNEWKDLPTFESVADALKAGEEIQFLESGSWLPWFGTGWWADIKFRSRPAQPKTKKVKVLGWLDRAGRVQRVAQDSAVGVDWKRAPSEDGEIEVVE